MIPNDLQVSQFFERAGADTPPALFIVPIVLTVLFLPVIDLLAGLGKTKRAGVSTGAPEAS